MRIGNLSGESGTLQGASFETVCEMTDLFEGNIIRATRRLDELMNQLCCAARVRMRL